MGCSQGSNRLRWPHPVLGLHLHAWNAMLTSPSYQADELALVCNSFYLSLAYLSRVSRDTTPAISHFPFRKHSYKYDSLSCRKLWLCRCAAVYNPTRRKWASS